jgi:hypothetical protein
MKKLPVGPVGIPEMVAVPFGLAVNVNPAGKVAFMSLIVATPVPVEMIVNDPSWLDVNLAWFELMIDGAVGGAGNALINSVTTPTPVPNNARSPFPPVVRLPATKPGPPVNRLPSGD